MAAFVKQFNLDGVDVDYEVLLVDFFNWMTNGLSKDFNAINAGDGQAEVTALYFMKDILAWYSYQAMGYFFYKATSQPAPAGKLHPHPCSLVIYHWNVI